MTGHKNAPPRYRAGVPTLLTPLVIGRVAGFNAGFGTGIALPLAPGTTSTWPTTRFGSSRPLVARMSVLLTLYFAASSSRVSVAATVTIRPVTGGMRSCWPLWRSVLDLRLFAHQTDIIETRYLPAMP